MINRVEMTMKSTRTSWLSWRNLANSPSPFPGGLGLDVFPWEPETPVPGPVQQDNTPSRVREAHGEGCPQPVPRPLDSSGPQPERTPNLSESPADFQSPQQTEQGKSGQVSLLALVGMFSFISFPLITSLTLWASRKPNKPSSVP